MFLTILLEFLVLQVLFAFFSLIEKEMKDYFSFLFAFSFYYSYFFYLFLSSYFRSSSIFISSYFIFIFSKLIIVFLIPQTFRSNSYNSIISIILFFSSWIITISIIPYFKLIWIGHSLKSGLSLSCFFSFFF